MGNVLSQILKTQARMETARDKLAALDSPEAKTCFFSIIMEVDFVDIGITVLQVLCLCCVSWIRSKTKVESFRVNLMKYHDELADLKSYFDSHMSDNNFAEENLGPMVQ